LVEQNERGSWLFRARRGRAGTRDDAENDEKQGSAEEGVAEGLIVWTGLIRKGAGEVKDRSTGGEQDEAEQQAYEGKGPHAQHLGSAFLRC
jgi:hypothetical protein